MIFGKKKSKAQPDKAQQAYDALRKALARKQANQAKKGKK